MGAYESVGALSALAGELLEERHPGARSRGATRATSTEELAAAVLAVAAAFRQLGVTWAIGGSVASVFHGEPRATNDVDVVAVLNEAQARRLPALLGEDFYADADMAVEAVLGKARTDAR